MLTFATFAALLPLFLERWDLSGTEAGWLSGLFFIGYTVAVPILTALTDRMDARRIYLASAVITGVAAYGFGFLADGFWSAVPFRVLAGIGLAGCYMPGLKALTDRIDVAAQPRAVSFYTSSFGIGSSISYYLAGEIAAAADWRWAFYIGGAGIFLTLLIAYTVLQPKPVPKPQGPRGRLLDFRPVLRNRQAMGYVLAYAAHNWELFGMRSWVVAFLAFSASLQPEGTLIWTGTAVAAVMGLLGTPSSIFGNEVATRFGRRRVVITFMLISAVVSCGLGLSVALPYVIVVGLCMLQGITVTWDSSAITTGTVQAADPAFKGATMAVHSTIGFVPAFLGALAPGIVLDLAGGTESQFAWAMAWVSMGIVAALGPLALLLLARRLTARVAD